MNTTKEQQKKLDDALVAPENYLKIEKSNLRLSSNLKSKEPNLQVLNGKSHTLNVDNFRDILKICPTLPGQPLLKEDILSFIRDLGHTVENKNSKKNNDMYYPCFTKVIIDYFMAKDQAIPRRNKMFWHYDRDDFMFTTIRVISKHKDTQEYGAILPEHLTNQAMLESEAFKTYRAYATGEKAPKSKATKKNTDSESSPKTKPSQASKGKRIKTSAKKDKPATTKSKGDGVDILSKVPDEQQQTRSGTNKGAGEDEEEDEEHDSDDDNDDNDDEDDDQEHDSQRTKSDDSGDDFVHPNLSTYKADEEELEKEEEKAKDDDEVISDQKVSTLPDYELSEEDENQQDDDTIGGEQEDEEDEELYGDLNINLNRRDAEMMDAQINQETEEAHINLTTEPPVVQQQSSFVSSDLVAKFIIHLRIQVSTRFKIKMVSSLEIELSELKQTNQFAAAVASIPGIVDNYLTSKMKDEVNVALQLKSDKLREEAQAENHDFLNLLDSNMKRIIKEQVKAKTSKIMTKVEKYVTENLGVEVLIQCLEESLQSVTRTYNSDKDLLSSYGEVVTLKRGRDDQDKDEEPSAGSNRGSLPKSSAKSNQEEEHEPKVVDLEEPLHQEFDTGNDVSLVREWMTKLAQASCTTSLFNEFLASPIDFSAFMMNRLNIQNLTSDLLTGLTYDLIKGTFKSVVELEYHLEEVFKATNDQLDWYNPEGRPYLSKPFPLILDARGRQIIPYDHFINNDLEYLKGGSSSRKYTTSITKTKAADYGHVK
ncbi:hypothetical protein Tco_0195225 [Tanacetum coccineum]